MTLHEAVHCLPADAVKPLSVPCRRHRAAIGEKCGVPICDTRYREAKERVIDERVKQAKGEGL